MALAEIHGELEEGEVDDTVIGTGTLEEREREVHSKNLHRLHRRHLPLHLPLHRHLYPRQ